LNIFFSEIRFKGWNNSFFIIVNIMLCMETLRIGILSTARISNGAVISPARHIPNVKIVAIASRNRWRAVKYALTHGIRKAYGSYEALLADPEIDAIYNPLPNSMHAEWSIKAMQAGKHVLCEKPVASNAREAMKMQDIAKQTGKVCAEAFHIRYHPFAKRLKDIIRSGELGEIKTAYAAFCINVTDKKNIRRRPELAGGGVMDVGCYCISILRLVAGTEPKVATAVAEVIDQNIDKSMHGELSFPNGITAWLDCTLLTEHGKSALKVEGTRGTISCNSPFDSHGNTLDIIIDGIPRKETIRTEGFNTTYYYQLLAFRDAIFNGAKMETDIADGIANMKVIDALYSYSGMKPRGTF